MQYPTQGGPQQVVVVKEEKKKNRGCLGSWYVLRALVATQASNGVVLVQSPPLQLVLAGSHLPLST